MDQATDAPAVAGKPRIHLMIEGATLLLIATGFFAANGASWWLYAALILAPDIAMAGYLAGPRKGAAIYNAFHNIVGPVLLAHVDFVSGTTLGVPLALIWAAHIGLDRMLGIGLKYDAGFGFTHLGFVGRASAAQKA